MYSKKECAIRLETVFKKRISVDEFEVDFQEALEQGINYLYADGFIAQDEIDYQIECFSGIKDLANVAGDDVMIGIFEELISFVKNSQGTKDE